MTEYNIVYSKKRIAKVNEGIRILELWLLDLAKEGIVSLGSRHKDFYKHIVKTLVAYNLGKISVKVSKIPQLIKEDSNWVIKVSEIVGELYLVVQAYKNIENLPEKLQIEVRTKIGWGQNHDTLLNQPVIKSKWFVVGQKKLKRFDKKSFIYTYLMEEKGTNIALIIRQLHKSKNFDKYLVTGYKFYCELQYYPRAFKLNANYTNRAEIETFENLNLEGFPDLKMAFSSLSDQVAENPWLSHFPMLLNNVSFVKKEKLLLVDEYGNFIPIISNFKYYEKIKEMELSNQVKIFGEWSGGEFNPLTVFSKDYFISFYNAKNLLL